MIEIIVEKAKRLLTLAEDGSAVFICRAALGREPTLPKEREGDGRTPEGEYRICLIKNPGKYGRSLGLSYPGVEDARRALQAGLIDGRTCQAILLAHQEGRRPPWGTPLGGEIYIHEGGINRDWTQGCIALRREDMDRLWDRRDEIARVILKP